MTPAQALKCAEEIASRYTNAWDAEDFARVILSHAQAAAKAREREIVEEVLDVLAGQRRQDGFTQDREWAFIRAETAIRERFAALLAECRVCQTAEAGLPTPGYAHDGSCRREKP